MRIEVYHLTDDGHVPNNAHLALLLYADAFGPDIGVDDVIEHLRRNQWGGAWLNGIYDFHHYHARSHEVLANLGSTVAVQFGGSDGPVIDFQRGAAVVIPAGVGHCRLSGSAGLAIVGAYPLGQEDWDLKRGGNSEQYSVAKQEIPRVQLPVLDPIYGAAGPVMEIWKTM